MMCWATNSLNKSFSYSYGSNNELRDVQIPGLGAVTISEYQWNLPTTALYPGGGTREYEYDGLMRLKQLTANDPGGNPLLDYSYEYDPAGNIERKTTEHGAYTYGYDAASRLTSANNPTLDNEAYTYDAVGNRLTASNATGTIEHNANNELRVYGDLHYDYDANGNVIEITLDNQRVFLYVYNTENRLVKVEGGNNNTIAEYDYDPFGRRLWKDVGGERTYFFYSDEGLIAEYDASGNEIRSYGYEPDSTWGTNPLWLKQDGEYYFYQNDHLGTPQKLVKQNGAVVWSAQYAAFGTAQVQTETVVNNLRFPGQYYDEETGLHYNFQRYYHPTIGRYLQSDLIGLAGGGVNLYEYVRNNPIRYLDVVGLIPLEPMQVWGEGIMAAPGGFGEPVVASPPVSECVDGLGECLARKAIDYVGQAINCADVAIKALIECAAEKNVPLTLPRIANVKQSKYTCFRSKDYKTPQAFFNAAQVLNAEDLFREDKITVPRDFEQLIPGDLILYDLGHHRNQTGATYTGHTRVVINNGKSWFLSYSGTTEIGAPAGFRLPYREWPVWWVPSIEVVEGHLSMPVERKTYAYEQLLREWLGPFKGKGRTWNCEIFKECSFTKECGR